MSDAVGQPVGLVKPKHAGGRPKGSGRKGPLLGEGMYPRALVQKLNRPAEKAGGKGGKSRKSRNKHPGSKYEKRYCRMIVEFFDIPAVEHKEECTVTKKGEAKTFIRDVANPLPHFSEFARKIGVSLNTLRAWRSRYPEFEEAYDRAFELQKKMFIDNGLAGHYNPLALRLLAHHMFNIREARDNNITGSLKINVTSYAAAEVPGLPALKVAGSQEDGGKT